MTKLDYHLLAALAAVIREGSFEAASCALNITQSAVSQRIKQLEARMGAVLIVRRRPCEATELGRRLCHHYERVSLLEHDLMMSLPGGWKEGEGEPLVLRIAVNADSIATWFPEVVARATEDLGILLDVLRDDQDYTIERLRSGQALAAVTAEVKPLHGFRSVTLGCLEYVAVASPRFCAVHFKEGLSREAVSQAPCLFFDRKDRIPKMWFEEAFAECPSLHMHRVPSFTGYLRCCRNGAGWGVVPKQAVLRDLSDGRLVALRPEISVNVPLFWQYSLNSGKLMRSISKIVLDVSRNILS